MGADADTWVSWQTTPCACQGGPQNMSVSVIVAGARTPIGRLLGALSGLSAVELGGIAIKSALERSGVAPEQVEYVIMGQVLQAGAGQIPSRQAAVNAGIPMTLPSVTINKVCLSGLDAIAMADQPIRAGEFDIVVAGGLESMTNAPPLLPGPPPPWRRWPGSAPPPPPTPPSPRAPPRRSPTAPAPSW